MAEFKQWEPRELPTRDYNVKDIPRDKRDGKTLEELEEARILIERRQAAQRAAGTNPEAIINQQIEKDQKLLRGSEHIPAYVNDPDHPGRVVMNHNIPLSDTQLVGETSDADRLSTSQGSPYQSSTSIVTVLDNNRSSSSAHASSASGTDNAPPRPPRPELADLPPGYVYIFVDNGDGSLGVESYSKQEIQHVLNTPDNLGLGLTLGNWLEKYPPMLSKKQVYEAMGVDDRDLSSYLFDLYPNLNAMVNDPEARQQMTVAEQMGAVARPLADAAAFSLYPEASLLKTIAPEVLLRFPRLAAALNMGARGAVDVVAQKAINLATDSDENKEFIQHEDRSPASNITIPTLFGLFTGISPAMSREAIKKTIFSADKQGGLSKALDGMDIKKWQDVPESLVDDALIVAKQSPESVEEAKYLFWEMKKAGRFKDLPIDEPVIFGSPWEYTTKRGTNSIRNSSTGRTPTDANVPTQQWMKDRGYTEGEANRLKDLANDPKFDLRVRKYTTGGKSELGEYQKIQNQLRFESNKTKLGADMSTQNAGTLSDAIQSNLQILNPELKPIFDKAMKDMALDIKLKDAVGKAATRHSGGVLSTPELLLSGAGVIGGMVGANKAVQRYMPNTDVRDKTRTQLPEGP